jgi:IMP dehydrogenase
MAGNVATLEGFDDLSDWGADSIRLGVGSGSICSTRVQTGCGYPMLQNIFDVAKTTRPAQIISDGGIREFGDIVKALAAGAHFVMMGSMFAGTDEAPGELIETERGLMKTYRGMASKEAQVDWRGFHSSNEGVSTMIPYKGPLAAVIADMINGVSTGCSYNGARSVAELNKNAVFVEVSHSSAVEATPHILRR